MNKRLGLSAIVLGFSAATANAAAIVDLWENDDHANYNGSKASWVFVAQNNSNNEPQPSPYNQKVSELRLFDLYSTETPTFGNLPDDWVGSTNAGTKVNAHNIILSCIDSASFINPGSLKSFEIVTYRPSDLPDVAVGTLYGQGRLLDAGLAPQDSFQGPIGVPEPSTLLSGLAGLTILATRRRRSEMSIGIPRQ